MNFISFQYEGKRTLKTSLDDKEDFVSKPDILTTKTDNINLNKSIF